MNFTDKGGKRYFSNKSKTIEHKNKYKSENSREKKISVRRRRSHMQQLVEKVIMDHLHKDFVK